MAIVGRLIREQQRLDAVANTPAAIQWRLDRAESGRLAYAEMNARFPVLSAENAREAIDFQAARIDFHMAALAAARFGTDRR